MMLAKIFKLFAFMWLIGVILLILFWGGAGYLAYRHVHALENQAPVSAVQQLK